jgi:hypothetical protein
MKGGRLMNRRVLFPALVLLALACLAWGADKSWTGVISDSSCGLKHSTASDEAADCVAKCVSGGGKYVLVSRGKVYRLDPQDKISSSLAGREAKVTGKLTKATITVSSAVAAPATKKGSGG